MVVAAPSNVVFPREIGEFDVLERSEDAGESEAADNPGEAVIEAVLDERVDWVMSWASSFAEAVETRGLREDVISRVEERGATAAKLVDDLLPREPSAGCPTIPDPTPRATGVAFESLTAMLSLTAFPIFISLPSSSMVALRPFPESFGEIMI